MLANQYAIYRVDPIKAGKELKHLPYFEAREKKLPIRIENYKQMQIGKMDTNEKAMDIYKKTKVYTEVSDVLVVNQKGELSCFYIDEECPRRITGFIQLNPTGAVITIDTKDYEIEGLSGKWMAADTLIIDGKQYYYMEHQEYRKQVAGVILDSYGKKVIQDARGFNDVTKNKIREATRPPEIVRDVTKTSVARLEHWQKFYENGTHERAMESGTEQGYNSVDGAVNNLQETNVSSTAHRGQAQKKKPSVLKKLREKQVAIAKRSGKPVPKYLEQQMNNERIRK